MGTFCITGNNKHENKILAPCQHMEDTRFCNGLILPILYEDLKVTDTPLLDWICLDRFVTGCIGLFLFAPC